jgi:hypothetical protein
MPQADGLLAGHRTTLVVVDVDAGAANGLGDTMRMRRWSP